MLLYNETPFVWRTYEYRTDDIDLGMANRSAAWTIPLLLNFFAGRGSSVGRASILTSGTHSWKENGHEKISTTIISLQEREVVSYLRKNVH